MLREKCASLRSAPRLPLGLEMPSKQSRNTTSVYALQKVERVRSLCTTGSAFSGGFGFETIRFVMGLNYNKDDDTTRNWECILLAMGAKAWKGE